MVTSTTPRVIFSCKNQSKGNLEQLLVTLKATICSKNQSEGDLKQLFVTPRAVGWSFLPVVG
jgi:hypothetical protein